MRSSGQTGTDKIEASDDRGIEHAHSPLNSLVRLAQLLGIQSAREIISSDVGAPPADFGNSESENQDD